MKCSDLPVFALLLVLSLVGCGGSSGDLNSTCDDLYNGADHTDAMSGWADAVAGEVNSSTLSHDQVAEKATVLSTLACSGSQDFKPADQVISVLEQGGGAIPGF